MSEQLTKEAFQDHLNTEFSVQIDPSTIVSVELLEFVEGESTPKQEQFSLMFRGPLETPFSQGIRALSHDKMGTFELFLVPISKNPDGMVYEAVFNRFINSTELT